MNKLIFIDFNETLCLHENWVDYNSIIVNSDFSFLFEKSIPNRPLIKYLEKESKDKNTKIYILNSMSSIFIKPVKQWCKEHCSNVKFEDIIGCSIDTTKANIIDMYRIKYKLEPKDIWYIEDSALMRKEALQRGFNTYSPLMFNILFT